MKTGQLCLSSSERNEEHVLSHYKPLWDSACLFHMRLTDWKEFTYITLHSEDKKETLDTYIVERKDWTENTGMRKTSAVISHMTDFLHIRNYLMSYAQDMFNLWSKTLECKGSQRFYQAKSKGLKMPAFQNYIY